MIKDLAWNTFKKTGNVNTFLELKQIVYIFSFDYSLKFSGLLKAF